MPSRFTGLQPHADGIAHGPFEIVGKTRPEVTFHRPTIGHRAPEFQRFSRGRMNLRTWIATAMLYSMVPFCCHPLLDPGFARA
jgi:hypothetical protein